MVKKLNEKQEKTVWKDSDAELSAAGYETFFKQYLEKMKSDPKGEINKKSQPQGAKY